MFGSDVLEVSLGLVLVFLLMSLVMTAVQEAIEHFFKTRASTLHHAVGELLRNKGPLVEAFYRHPLIYGLYSGEYEGAGPRKRLPSYIPRETFSTALLDLRDSAESFEGKDELANLLSGFARVAPDTASLRRELEAWFDGAMDRASGWYKRRTQFRLFFIGLGVALVLNVNAIAIANHLATNPQQRALVTALADRAAEREPGGELLTEAEREELREEIGRLGIPIGWQNAEWRGMLDRIPPFGWPPTPGDTVIGAITTLNLFLGYLITAFALMLGAPFWFDVLNRIMVIRSTVKPKEKSPDEPSEDGARKRRKVDVTLGRDSAAEDAAP